MFELMLILQARITRLLRPGGPDYYRRRHMDETLDTALEVTSLAARVEHGAACYRRQNTNRPW